MRKYLPRTSCRENLDCLNGAKSSTVLLSPHMIRDSAPRRRYPDTHGQRCDTGRPEADERFDTARIPRGGRTGRKTRRARVFSAPISRNC